jgi:hypothetical protein
VKVAGILPTNDEILPLMVFLVGKFFVRAKRRKIFSSKSFLFKNNFVKNILQRKTFYVKINKA